VGDEPWRDGSGEIVPPDGLPAARLARREPFERLLLQRPTCTILASGALTRLGDGMEVGVVTGDDVTDIEAARRRARLLADAGAQLADANDLAATLAAVGRAVVPAFADWCFVEMLQPDGAIERVLIEHRDPSRREFIEEYDRRYPLDPNAPIGSPAVIRTGRPELLTELTDEMLASVAVDEEQLRLLRSAGFISSVVVPLRVRGVIIGDLALASSQSGRRYEEADIATVQELADRCAMAIDTARLHDDLRQAELDARRSRDELHAMLSGVADAITAQDRNGRVVYANPAALERLGYPSVEALAAAPPAELRERFKFGDEEGRPLPIEALPGRRALAGEDAEPVIVRHRSPSDGELRWARVQATPVRDVDGTPWLAINVIEDITDIKRAEHGYRFLADASHVLAGSLDYQATLRTVADLAVPHIADWCGVDVVENDELVPVAVAHVDPARVELALEFRKRYPPRRDSLTHTIVETGQVYVVPEITDEMLVDAAVDDEHLRMMRELGLRSVMAVPMTLRDHVLGVITFVAAEAGRRFDAQDIALAQDLALRAAAAIDNARLYEASAAIAQTLQASLLPPHLPELPGAELAAVYRPAAFGLDVGGDFYDVFDVTDGEWFLVVGDVCGKGAEAAAITALARYTIRAAAVRRRSPSSILRVLNEAMLRQGTDGRFCTIACAHLDLRRSPARLTVACGGHPAPMVLRADGTVEEVGVAGTLLGMVDKPELEDRSTQLRPGDAVVSYTDGLTDAAAPARTWSVPDVASALAASRGHSAVAIAEHLVDAALGGVASPRDDVALLALRMAA
jgi:serine phosphatase RsbU (regulator of sigma subunit)/PAS domain-containing protein